jgi:hypothetical protein
MTETPVTTSRPEPPEGEDAELDGTFAKVWGIIEEAGNPQGLTREHARTVLWEQLARFRRKEGK